MRVKLGSFFVNRENFHRLVFAEFDANQFGFIDITIGKRVGNVAIVNPVYRDLYVSTNGKETFVDRQVFTAAAHTLPRLEEAEFSGKAVVDENGDPVAKRKPDHIRVIRYIRRRNEDGHTIGDYGVTLVFDVNFLDMKFACAYSMCNGDTFSKEGVKFALDAAHKRNRYVIAKYNKNISLFDNLLAALYTKLKDGNLTDEERTLFEHVTVEWAVRSGYHKE